MLDSMDFRRSIETSNRPIKNFRFVYRFLLDVGANMPPFSFQKSTNIAEELELGSHRIFVWFLHGFVIDFPSIWDANLELCWSLRLLQDASKTPPRRSKMLPKTLWIAQDGPRGVQTCPGALRTSILLPPGLNFEVFVDIMLIFV